MNIDNVQCILCGQIAKHGYPNVGVCMCGLHWYVNHINGEMNYRFMTGPQVPWKKTPNGTLFIASEEELI